MTRLIIDAGQIRAFGEAVFKHASDGQIISLRTFEDGKNEQSLNIHPVPINGGGIGQGWRVRCPNCGGGHRLDWHCA
jgi:hypothetical protein